MVSYYFFRNHLVFSSSNHSCFHVLLKWVVFGFMCDHNANYVLIVASSTIMEPSNDIPSVKRRCNQSEIAVKWWSEKQVGVAKFAS